MKILISALLSVALLLTLPAESPKNIKKLESVATTSTQQTESVKQPPSKPSEHLTKPVKSDVSTVEEAKPQPQPTPQVAVAPTSDLEAEAKAFIYHKESSTNPKAENYLGCYGLGQDCNGIVKKKCGSDYNCQDTFFTDYMKRRYGSWQKAKQFWLARVAINGRDVGHWW